MTKEERKSYNEYLHRFIENKEFDVAYADGQNWIGLGPKNSSEYKTKMHRLFTLVGFFPIGLNCNQSWPPVCMNYAALTEDREDWYGEEGITHRLEIAKLWCQWKGYPEWDCHTPNEEVWAAWEEFLADYRMGLVK